MEIVVVTLLILGLLVGLDVAVLQHGTSAERMTDFWREQHESQYYPPECC